MIYLNAILFAVFTTFFSWEEDQALRMGTPWQVLGAGLGLLLALWLLLSTVRHMQRGGGQR